MQRRSFLQRCGQALLLILPGSRIAADGPPLRRVNFVAAKASPAAGKQECEEEGCACEGEGCVCDGDTCANDFSCTQDVSGECATRDTCTDDGSGVCDNDYCDSDHYSVGDCPPEEVTICTDDTCTNDYCASDKSLSCTDDECVSDSSGECSDDVCISDKSGQGAGDLCEADSSGACETDECSSDKSAACFTDLCVSDKSGFCTADTCTSDSSGECETDQCVSDSSGECHDDACVSDSSGGCVQDACIADSSGSCGNDHCASDKSGACYNDTCTSDSSGECGVKDSCTSDKSGACDVDQCVTDASDACGADICRVDKGGYCETRDVCGVDLPEEIVTGKAMRSALQALYRGIMGSAGMLVVVALCLSGCKVPDPWHAVSLSAGLADAVPMDIDVPTVDSGWIVGLEMSSAKMDDFDIFGDEGEMDIPTPPGTTGLILRLVPSGWVKATPPDLGTNWGLYGASGTSASNGWLAGGDFTQPPPDITFEGEIEDEWKSPDSDVWAKDVPAERYGAVALRDPGSGAFETAMDPESTVYTAVAAAGAQDLWVANLGGLQRLTNGVWNYETLPSDIGGIQAMAFISAEDGWIAGSKGTIGAIVRRTTGTWTTAQLPAITEPWEVLGIAALPDGEAWAVGYSTDETAETRTAVLLHCAQGAWQSITPPAVSANWYLESVSFPNASEGWAAGTDLIAHAGVVLHYKDGAWAVEKLPGPNGGNWTLVGISFPSTTSGWAVGYDNANVKMLMFQYMP